MNQKGQLILTLILVMAVALAIGLSVIQKSLVDISTSTKVEQSSRAFSAAEAGIENALQGGGSSVNFSQTTGSSAEVSGSTDWGPPAAAANVQQAPLEYPPLSKEEVAQVWLANPDSTSNPPAEFYKRRVLDIYWGNSATGRAAIELTLIYYDTATTSYKSRKWYLDQNITRSPQNGFTQVTTCNGGYPNPPSSFTSTYQCKFTLGGSADLAGSLPASGLMLLRARLLYNSSSQPFAVQPPSSENSSPDHSLPAQAKSFTSTGKSGETQRRVKLFQLKKVVPTYFDYAIFSAGDIKK